MSPVQWRRGGRGGGWRSSGDCRSLQSWQESVWLQKSPLLPSQGPSGHSPYPSRYMYMYIQGETLLVNLSLAVVHTMYVPNVWYCCVTLSLTFLTHVSYLPLSLSPLHSPLPPPSSIAQAGREGSPREVCGSLPTELDTFSDSALESER